jgi:uncharacterized protein (TIGR02598 family)
MRRGRRGGFTLVEVALATAVAAVALMGLLGLAMIAMRWGRNAVDETIVGTIAEDVFTDMKAGGYASLPGYVSANSPKDYDREGNPGTPAYYRCYIAVSNLAPIGVASPDVLRQVQLTFVWPNVNDFANAPNTNVFLTRIANLRPY